VSKILFPSRKQKKNGQLATSARLAPGGSFSSPGASCKTVVKVCANCPVVSNYRQAVTNSSAWLALGWRPLAPGVDFVSLGASC